MSLESWLTTDSETPFLLKHPQSAFQASAIQIPPGINNNKPSSSPYIYDIQHFGHGISHPSGQHPSYISAAYLPTESLTFGDNQHCHKFIVMEGGRPCCPPNPWTWGTGGYPSVPAPANRPRVREMGVLVTHCSLGGCLLPFRLPSIYTDLLLLISIPNSRITENFRSVPTEKKVSHQVYIYNLVILPYWQGLSIHQAILNYLVSKKDIIYRWMKCQRGMTVIEWFSTLKCNVQITLCDLICFLDLTPGFLTSSLHIKP